MAPSAQWYRPDTVPAAFELLLAVSDEDEGRAAYNAMLFAVGNNHAGLLYPAAVPAAPLLARVARERESWIRWAALEILIEFTAFRSDREEFVDPSGTVVRPRYAIIAPIRNLKQHLQLMAEHEGSGAPTAQSARELLDRLLDAEKGWTGSGSD